MKLRGKRIKLHQWIRGDGIAVRVEVEAVIPDADPSEPCLEPDVTRYLDRLQELANAGDIEQLKQHGEVYIRQPA